MSFFRRKSASPPSRASSRQDGVSGKQKLTAENFRQGLELLDAEFEKSELLCAISPIKVTSAGGFLAVTYLKNRESTVDIDYCIDPELYDNEDVKEDMRIATEAVAKHLLFPNDWFNDEMTMFTSRSVRPKLFQDSLNQGLVLWKGKRLVIYAMKFEWAFERKARRIANSVAGRDDNSDLSDAVAILNLLVGKNNGQPLEWEYVKNLNINGFDIELPDSTLETIARSYNQTYNRHGLERKNKRMNAQ